MKIYVNQLCPQCDELVNALLNELKDRPAEMAEIELVQVTNENIDAYGVTKVPTILPSNESPVLGVSDCFEYVMKHTSSSGAGTSVGTSVGAFSGKKDEDATNTTVEDKYERLLAMRKEL